MRPNPRDATLEHFAERTIREARLLPARSTVLVAVSGGPDSVALLHFLRGRRERAGSPLRLVAAHVNHALRGRESDEDAIFVRELAASWGIPLLERKLDPTRPGARSEDGARVARYDTLRAMAASVGADRVAVAHTSDDQVETVLFKLFRGAGLRGLAGMPVRGRVRGVRVVRPFLEVAREQVRGYLARHGLRSREDSTNESRAPSRNFVRHEIVPRVRERLNPAVREAVLRGARAAREAEEYCQAEARRLLPEILRRESGEEISLDAPRLLAYPKPLRAYLFRLALTELAGHTRDLSGAHIDALLSLAATPGARAADLPGNLRARRWRNRIVLGPRIVENRRREASSKA